MEHVALAVDGLFLIFLWGALATGRGDLTVGAVLLLLVLLAWPAPGRRMGPIALLIAVGVLVGIMTFAATGGAVAVRPDGFVEPRQGLAVVFASASLAGVLWLLLWRGVADRPAPWKPVAFAICLVFFLLAPALLILLGYTGPVDARGARVALAVSALALAAAAALPFADATGGDAYGSHSGAGKRL